MSVFDKALYRQWDKSSQLIVPRMTGVLYNTLARRWQGEVFQTWPRKEVKYQIACIEVFAGKDVVDVGSNAGLLTWELARFARSFIGVERDPVAYAQSLITQQYIPIPGRFLNWRMRKFALKCRRFNFNAVFASRVLYHLNDYEVALLKRRVLSRCSVVVFVANEGKGEEKMENSSRLHRSENLRRFLEGCDFEVELVNKNTNWTSVVGRREVRDEVG